MSQISISNEIRLESMSMMNLVNSAPTESDSNVSSSSDSNKRNKGSLFQKSFILLDELGRGGYGFVYRCLNKKNRRMYAVKWNINPADMAGLKEEFFTVSDICFPNGHVNIVNVLGSICDDQIVYNIFELASGGDLASDLEEKGYYSEAFAADIVKQVLQGVDYIHSRGYLHRDIKPQNLLILKSSYLHIKITDFGLAIRRKKGLNYADKNNNQIFAYIPWQHGFAGTESYISPEIMKSHKYDYDCDIWSCGVVLYEILSGYLPFDEGIPAINTLSDLFPMPEWRGLDQAIDLIKQIFDRVKSVNAVDSGSVQTSQLPSSCLGRQPSDVDNYHQQTFLTARQALDHPFFAKNCYNRKLRPDMSSAMVHFLGMKRLKSEFIKIRKDNFNF